MLSGNEEFAASLKEEDFFAPLSMTAMTASRIGDHPFAWTLRTEASTTQHQTGLSF
jgi:hypothetical protein